MRYRKKPVVIEAWQWDETADMLEMLKKRGMKWAGNTGHRDRPGWIGQLRIKTLESAKGSFLVDLGDWIIRGVKGEFYACKPDIFAMTYEPEMIRAEATQAWRSMDTAPKGRRILLMWDDRIECGSWDDQRYNKKPRPFWTGDGVHIFGIGRYRDTPPDGWMPLPDCSTSARNIEEPK